MGKDMIIRKCTLQEIPAAGAFYDKVVKTLEETVNYPKWTYKVYPSEEYAREMTEQGMQYLCLDKEQIVGAFVLNNDPQGSYEKASWSREVPEGGYLVCHALAADPERKGSGIGKYMVEYCIRYAKEKGFPEIRLDVVPGNIPAKKLYESCGFHCVGDVDLERNIPEIPVFSMYEREIDGMCVQ